MIANNKYIINMKKDIGRRKNIDHFCEQIGASYWDGIDEAQIDKNGYLINITDEISSTINAKNAKLNLFNHFLKSNQTDEYLWLFEDDIYIHKSFYSEVGKVNDFLIKEKPLLFYLGVSNNKVFDYNYNDIINIELLFKNTQAVHDEQKTCLLKIKPCSGAYGVIIRRSIIPNLISYIKNPGLIKYPFDNSCLGKIQINFPNKCFVTNPPLVVPDITISNIRKNYDQKKYWNKFNINPNIYIYPKYFYLFVVINDNFIDKLLISEFKNLYKLFCPYFKIIYLCDKININTSEYYEFLITNGNKVDDIINDKLLLEKYNGYYLKTTINVIFKYYEGEKIINCIENNIKNFDILQFKINKQNKESYFIVKKFPLYSNNFLIVDNIDLEIY